MSGILFIISAPSGSGKSTLVSSLRAAVPHLEFSISCTTRKARGSEANGREYYFISREDFEQMIKRSEFLEYAEVFGNYYGTPKRFLEEAAGRGNDLLLDIDVQGEKQVKQKVPDSVSIFVLPPSRTELEARLRRRSRGEGVDSEETISRRLLMATKEIENYRNYDYILVNDRLEQSVDTLEAIVLSERAKRSGRPLSAEELKLAEQAKNSLQGNCVKQLAAVLATFDMPVSPGPG